MNDNGVSDRLASIEQRITAACDRSGRARSDVALVGAAKRQAPERLRAASRAGLADFGENIVQEAEEHRALLEQFELTWHLIGPLQSNKVRKAVALFDCVHAVDRLKIARALDREAEKAERKLIGFLEVNIGRETTKHGFDPDQVPEILGETRRFQHLEIRGLMAIPPVPDSADDARKWFRRLRELRDRSFPNGGCLSMGMSADFEVAIEEGATHVRIGSALFGERASRSS